MSQKTLLPNGYSIGKMTVFPSNWNQKNASLETDWRIQYRYYHPIKYPKGLLRPLRGMNEIMNLQDRQAKTRDLMADLIFMLKRGWCPVKRSFPVIETNHQIGPTTPMFSALEWARNEADVVHPTKLDIKSQLKFLKEAADRMNLDLPIGEVRRRHIKLLLKNVEENRPIWNNGRFNKYRANLQTLFKELLEIDAIETNPINDIGKKTEDEKIRETLTREQRRQVDLHLRKKKMMRYRLYNRLFFHTGIRSTELLTIKAKDVDLADQLVKVTIRKRKKPTIVYKTIKTIAVRYWKLALKNCPADYYVFSKLLKPGPTPIDAHQISRRWNTHVKPSVEKGGLGITADFYAFKHGNSTEMIDDINYEAAAALNSHTGTAMVRRIYDTKRVSREHEKIKKASNEY